FSTGLEQPASSCSGAPDHRLRVRSVSPAIHGRRFSSSSLPLRSSQTRLPHSPGGRPSASRSYFSVFRFTSSGAASADPDDADQLEVAATRKTEGAVICAAGHMPGQDRSRLLMDDRIRGFAQRIWNYHHLNHELARADAILVLCSHDVAVAVRGAELYLQRWAPLLIFAGGLGAITSRLWQEPEADQFARVAIEMGVPR